VYNFACGFFYKSSTIKHNTGNRKNLSKNAIHNLGWNITISAHIYKMNYSYNTHLHTWTTPKCSKLIPLSISACPGSVTTCFLILNVSLGKVTLCCGYAHKLQADCPWSKGTEQKQWTASIRIVCAPPKFKPAPATYKWVQSSLVHDTSPRHHSTE
jgi:hypothetical protein